MQERQYNVQLRWGFFGVRPPHHHLDYEGHAKLIRSKLQMHHFWGIGKLLQTELFELYTIFHVEQVHLNSTKLGLPDEVLHCLSQ